MGSRLRIDSTRRYLPAHEKAGKFVSFHKLSQWLTYSLMEPLQVCSLRFSILLLEPLD